MPERHEDAMDKYRHSAYTIYTFKTQYVVTRDELMEAITSWKEGADYYCLRLDIIISPHYSSIEPLQLDVSDRRIL